MIVQKTRSSWRYGFMGARTGLNILLSQPSKNQMPNLATVMKNEIVRLARKEVRAEVLTLRKAATSSRTDINALKRRVAALEKQISSLSKASPAKEVEPENESTPIRFSSKGFAALRLGLIYPQSKWVCCWVHRISQSTNGNEAPSQGPTSCPKLQRSGR